MKKFTLFLVAALLMTVTSMAQKPAAREFSPNRVAALAPSLKADAKKMPSQASLQKQVDPSRLRAARAVLAGKGQKAKVTEQASKDSKGVLRAPKKTITGDEEFITEQPEGRQQIYSRSGDAYYVNLFWLVQTSFTGAVGNVVFGENNEVYVKNIFSQLPTNSWVKGTLNGSKIVFEFPQMAFEQEGDSYYAELLSYVEDEDWYVTAENQTLTLNYNATTQAITCPTGSNIATGNVIVGLVDESEEWAGYGDWNFKMTLMTDEPVTAPEGLETTDYAVVGEGVDGTLAKVGFQGNDVYVQGLYANMPEAWVKGTIEGDKAVFKTGQYMGADFVTNYHQYLVSAIAEEKYDEYYEEYYTEYELSNEDVTFDYDAETKTFSNSSCFLINAGKTTVYYTAAYNKAKMYPFVEVAATPATPTWNELFEGGYDYYNYGYGWGYLDFEIPSVDVNGDFILPEKITYQIYTKVNGEEKPLRLSADHYAYLDEDMDEVPYDFSDGWDFYAQGANHNIYYYVVGPEAFGVQAIYRGAGEERRSEIAWNEVYDLGSEIQPDAATPDYPDIDPSDTGSSIGYGFYTGAEDVYSFGEAVEDTYDVAIHLQNEALVGTHVESITFPLMGTRGVSNIKAWLSSQLRVEDGKNVPDLVSVDVTDAKAGYVTVKLEKPYTIPEEGVYVGYSLTIDDASREVNQQPLGVILQSNEGGFYLHTGREFLKWLDLSEGLGINAAIQVTVGGSKVSENAVAAVPGETVYVTTKNPFEAEVQFINHGSKGIKSLDIDYTLAGGLKGSQHIDLKTPVDGFFGKAYTTTLTMPELSSPGNYDLEIDVVKVNGVDNADPASMAKTPIVALNTLPKKRTVMEEYTGTWCGWCPRGFVALEKLAKLSEGEYVLLSYHNNDPMEIMEFFPSSIAGFPDAWLDRAEEVDPYYGTSNTDFFIAQDMARRNKQFGHAAIEFQSEMSEDGQAINVSTSVIFPFSSDDAKYGVEYILVADGLTGEAGSDWDQTNYYAGGSDGRDLASFNKAGDYVQELVFNDVVILAPQSGFGIPESIPAEVKADVPVEHSYSFLLADAVNMDGESLLQPQAKLKVAVLLIDYVTGQIVNANIAPVGAATGIASPEADQSQLGISSVRYYDLGGRQLTAPQRGINIVSITYNNGTVQTLKMKR